MAPSRRKGSARAAAAAAAARQHWKIGDLVLAKMKGFPAWPAMISEPEKWGFSSDRKKLLVYFYGTKQIAFCNYADIEVFTEEKKKSLLIKRQGKGSDFVRAVEEIVDVYESLKKESLARDSSFVEGNDGRVSNQENLEEPIINCFVQNVVPSLSSSLNHQSQAASVTECCDKVTADGIPGALLDGRNDNNIALINDSTEKISILDELRQIPLSSITTTRKRERDVHLPSSVTNLSSSLRRSRSSAGNKPCKSQKSYMQVNSKCDVVCSEEPKLKEQIVVRGSHITTSAEASSISTSAPLEDIMSVKSEVPNSDDGSLQDFSGKLEPSENDTSSNTFSNGDFMLNVTAEIPSKIVVTKDGRKPPAYKKQVSSSRSCSEMDKELDFLIEGGSFSDSSNSRNGIIDKLSNTDGDEHLPLVKRARVRMGKLPMDEEKDNSVGSKVHLDTIVSSNGFYGNAGVSSPVINCSILNGPPKRTSPVAKEVAGSSTNAGAHCNTGEEMLSCKASKYQLMPDVEAALPPSKRLHRALEAMSANAVEADDDWSEAPSAIETKSSSCLGSSSENVGCVNTDVGVGSPVKPLPKQPSESDAFHDTACHLTSSSTSQDLTVICLNSSKMEHINTLKEKVLSSFEENSKEILTGNSHLHGSVNSKITVPLSASSSELVEEPSSDCGLIHSPSNVIDENDRFQGPQLDKESTYFQRYGRALLKGTGSCDSRQIVGLSPSSRATMDLSASNDICSASEIDGAVAVSLARIADSSACDMNGIPSISSATDVGFLAGDLNGGAAALLNTKVSFEANDISKAAMSSRVRVEGNSQIRDMQNIVVEAKQKSALRNRSMESNLAPIKELIAAAQAKRFLSRSTSFSDNVIDGKIGPDTVVSPSLINKEDSSGRGSPSNPMFYHRPFSDDGTCYLQNGSRTPLSSSSGKGVCKLINHAEANAARRSFESMLCTLSRTKESIGRATRIAIDCAKYGIAGEVIDILLRYLEKESSLHRRVDLFFLVDSITQCSHFQKGGHGDVFPSLVQAVLPRILSAAAPPGNGVSENRRQCLKVLRLWLERRTLPEFIVRHHIRELEHGSEPSLSISFSRRPSRTERALNDPVREMEGMLVDEYGSNASFQLPQLFNARILEYEEGSVDEKVFEAVTPDRNAEIDYGKEMTPKSTKKHRLVLEDVDGELEMEDVAPPSGNETERSTCHGTGAEMEKNCKFQCEQNESLTFAPPLPEDLPPSPPPLPSSPPPMPPSCTSTESQAPRTSAGLNAAADRADFNLSRACYTTQSQLPQPITQPTSLHGSSSLSEPVSFYSKVYECHPQRMPPLVSSCTSSGSYLNFPDSQPAIPLGNNPQPIVNMPSANKVYHLPPPPPVVSNQFSYIQAPPHRPQASENHSSYSDRLRQSHDIQRGNFHLDRVQMGPVNGDVTYPAVPTGCMGSGSEKVETQVTAFYGPHLEPSSGPCQAWSYPPRTSTYPVSAHISPLENPVSGVTGAPAYWRAR